MKSPVGYNYLIGSTMYMGVQGHYMKVEVPQTASMIDQMRSPARAAEFAKSHAVKDLGPSSVGGVAAHAYGYDVTSNGESVHSVMDVGQASGLPLRVTTKAKNATTVVMYSRYDVPVTINPPA